MLLLFDMYVVLLRANHELNFFKRINPENMVVFIECDSIHVEVVLVMIYQNL